MFSLFVVIKGATWYSGKFVLHYQGDCCDTLIIVCTAVVNSLQFKARVCDLPGQPETSDLYYLQWLRGKPIHTYVHVCIETRQLYVLC